MDFRENAKEAKPNIKLQDAEDENCSLHEIREDARKILLLSLSDFNKAGFLLVK